MNSWEYAECRKDKNKQLTYKVFVVPVKEEALLGVPDVELLDILSIMYNTIHGSQQ